MLLLADHSCTLWAQVMEDARKHAHVSPLRISTDWWLAAFIYIWWLIQVEVGGDVAAVSQPLQHEQNTQGVQSLSTAPGALWFEYY
jgi:hypothetical protein